MTTVNIATGAAQTNYRGHTTVTRFGRMLLLLLIPAFIAYLVIAQQEVTDSPALGLQFGQERASGTWIVTDVSLTSEAHDTRVDQGNDDVLDVRDAG